MFRYEPSAANALNEPDDPRLTESSDPDTSCAQCGRDLPTGALVWFQAGSDRVFCTRRCAQVVR